MKKSKFLRGKMEEKDEKIAILERNLSKKIILFVIRSLRDYVITKGTWRDIAKHRTGERGCALIEIIVQTERDKKSRAQDTTLDDIQHNERCTCRILSGRKEETRKIPHSM